MGSSALRLNHFQRFMRRWRELAPYNAVHALRVSGPADRARWADCLHVTIRETGLGIPGEGDREIRFAPESAVAVAEAPVLDEALRAELNTPFGKGALPLRFTIVPEPDAHWLVLGFEHWLADSRSIRALLERAFARYSGAGALPPLTLDQPARTGCGGVLANVRAFIRHRAAYRLPVPEPMNFETGFLRREFAPGTVTQIRTAARAAGGTVNDLFIAAAAQTMGDFIRVNPRARRHKVAIATAVDLRPRSRAATFGFELGQFSVLLDRPETLPPRALVAAIMAQTRRFKTSAGSLREGAPFGLGCWWWDRCGSRWQRALMVHRAFPVVAGISNVNLTASWVTRSPGALDYVRVSPTGPLLPLVWTLTTIGERLAFCLTFRRTIFSENAGEQLARQFQIHLETLAEKSLVNP